VRTAPGPASLASPRTGAVTFPRAGASPSPGRQATPAVRRSAQATVVAAAPGTTVGTHVQVSGSRVERRRGEETVVQTAERCLREGVIVGAYVGCAG